MTMSFHMFMSCHNMQLYPSVRSFVILDAVLQPSPVMLKYYLGFSFDFWQFLEFSRWWLKIIDGFTSCNWFWWKIKYIEVATYKWMQLFLKHIIGITLKFSKSFWTLVYLGPKQHDREFSESETSHQLRGASTRNTPISVGGKSTWQILVFQASKYCCVAIRYMQLSMC